MLVHKQTFCVLKCAVGSKCFIWEHIAEQMKRGLAVNGLFFSGEWLGVINDYCLLLTC